MSGSLPPYPHLQALAYEAMPATRRDEDLLIADARIVLAEIDRLRTIEVAAQVAVDCYGDDTEYAAMESLRAVLNGPQEATR